MLGFNFEKKEAIPLEKRKSIKVKVKTKTWQQFPSWHFVLALLKSVKHIQKIIRSCEKSKMYRFRTQNPGSPLIRRHRLFTCFSVIGGPMCFIFRLRTRSIVGRFAQVSVALCLPVDLSRSDQSPPEGWTNDGNQWMGNVSYSAAVYHTWEHFSRHMLFHANSCLSHVLEIQPWDNSRTAEAKQTCDIFQHSRHCIFISFYLCSKQAPHPAARTLIQ